MLHLMPTIILFSDPSFTTTPCGYLKRFNIREFDDKTWEECKDLCLADDRCKSFDWREKTGYNCAIQDETRQTQPQDYVPISSCSNDDWGHNEKIEGT